MKGLPVFQVIGLVLSALLVLLVLALGVWGGVEMVRVLLRYRAVGP